MRISIYILIFTIILLVYYKNIYNYFNNEGFFSPRKIFKKKLGKIRHKINRNNIHNVEVFSNFLKKNVRKYKI